MATPTPRPTVKYWQRPKPNRWRWVIYLPMPMPMGNNFLMLMASYLAKSKPTANYLATKMPSHWLKHWQTRWH